MSEEEAEFSNAYYSLTEETINIIQCLEATNVSDLNVNDTIEGQIPTSRRDEWALHLLDSLMKDYKPMKKFLMLPSKKVLKLNFFLSIVPRPIPLWYRDP